MTVHVGVLVPLRPGAPRGTPEEMPIGRVALRLRAEGIEAVFGREAEAGRVTGFLARPRRWAPVEGVAVVGAYDRYPSKKDPTGHADLQAGLSGLPLVNPAALTLLCRDKLACQRHLEARDVRMPEVTGDPATFEEALAAWGAAFVKPRYGAFGSGVRRLLRGDPVPRTAPGAVQGAPEPTLLQRAVPAPDGWAGISVRLLVQRDEHATWVTNPAVARRNRTDPVVNVARGAEAAPATDVLAPDTMRAIERAGLQVAEALSDHPDGAWLGELGVDLAIDPANRPWVIEVNSRPRGRLEALAEADPGRWMSAHLTASARPLRFLARRSAGGLAT